MHIVMFVVLCMLAGCDSVCFTMMISANNIGQEGAKALAPSLKQLKKLTQLALASHIQLSQLFKFFHQPQFQRQCLCALRANVTAWHQQKASSKGLNGINTHNTHSINVIARPDNINPQNYSLSQAPPLKTSVSS